ncbi:MAG: alpha/beta hydrolase [Leptolyngbya sp. SIO4C1]|nr:alpha/beta hydrolase [Leptolyngbya sp. SIO4C1]
MGNQRRARWYRWLALGLGCGLLNGTTFPSWSAERITFSYGPLERSIEIEDLEIYAKEGYLTPELQAYARYFSADDLEQFRSILTEQADIGVQVVDRFLYTSQGEYLLEIAGDLIQTGARLNGSRALRGSLILSAADPDEGLTLLNMLKRFSSPTIRVNIAKGIEIAREVDRAVYQADTVMEIVEEQAMVESTKAAKPDLSGLLSEALKPGPYSVNDPITLKAQFSQPFDLYIPNLPSQRFARPAVVISHGLGGDRTSYAYLARHLTSHGFVVINVEHPGSSAAQVNNLLAGRAADVIPDAEFIRRPTDISDILDTLEKRARTDPKLRGLIDFERVGVLGQSFGGYTSLALAGAPLDFASIVAQCTPKTFSLNLSLLLQCQATEIANPNLLTRDLSDDRIKAAIAISPISSVLFGENSLSQVDVPMLVMASSADTVAPALPEQIVPFTWLGAPEKYLVLLRNGTHFSTIGLTATGSETFDLPEPLLGPDIAIAQDYVRALSLAFFEVHLADNSNFSALLTSNAAAQLSQSEMPLSLVRELSPLQIELGLETAADQVEFNDSEMRPDPLAPEPVPAITP